jgi:hypothetical protein
VLAWMEAPLTALTVKTANTHSSRTVVVNEFSLGNCCAADEIGVVGLIPDFYLQAGRLLMTRRLSLAFLFLFAMFVGGLSGAFARPVLAAKAAANCDLATCVSNCRTFVGEQQATTGTHICNTTCLQTLQERQAKGHRQAAMPCTPAGAGW